MTVEQAIEIVTNVLQSYEYTTQIDNALAIAQRAMEKRIPKKATPFSDNKLSRYLLRCPTCGGDCILPSDKYCANCGQAIDWSDEK